MFLGLFSLSIAAHQQNLTGHINYLTVVEADFSQEVSWSPVIKKFGDSRILSIFLLALRTFFSLHLFALPCLKWEGEF